MRALLKRALVPLTLMAWIYFLSAQPDLNSGLGIIDLIGRKVIHAVTYFSLAFAWWWALVPSIGRRALWAAVAIAFLYACSDEVHQLSVQGRHGSLVDVAVDSIGIAAAIVFVRRGAWRRFARSNRADEAPPPV